MEPEQYFNCPVCGSKVLKRKGIMLMWTTVCKNCYEKMNTIYNDSEQRKNGN